MNDDSFLRDNRILAARYRVDRRVASGGFGIVYAAHHLVLEVPVAIKVLHERFAGAPDSGEAVAAFLQEARTLARLRHPNIVGVIDAGIVPGTSVPWIALEWCDGKTLDLVLSDGDVVMPMSPAKAWKLLRPVAEAIAYAHDQRVVHRDLKPTNIMVVRASGELVPRVVDFGLAKAIEAAEATSTTTMRRAFTPAYAAPEQIMATGTGAWTDVHALALLFSQLVTGERPYPRGDELTAAMSKERPTPRLFGVEIATKIHDVVERALSVDRAARQPDGGVFLREMDAAIHEARDAAMIRTVTAPGGVGARVVDPSVSVGGVDAPRARSTAPGSRRSVFVAGAIVASLAALAVTAFVTWRVASRSTVASSASPLASAPAVPMHGIVTNRSIPAHTRDTFEAAVRAAGYRVDSTQENVSAGAYHQLTILGGRPPCSGSLQLYAIEGPFSSKEMATSMRTAMVTPIVIARDGARVLLINLTDVASGPSARCNNELFVQLTSPKIDGAPEDDAPPSAPPPPPPPEPAKLADDAVTTRRLRAAKFEILRDERRNVSPGVVERWLTLRKGNVSGTVAIVRGFDQAAKPYADTMRARAGESVALLGKDWFVMVLFDDMGIAMEISAAVKMEADAGAR